MKLRARPSGPLRGEAEIPGDKSLSHRALIIGALAEGETRIAGLAKSGDVDATARALRQFGIAIDADEGMTVVRGGEWRSPDAPVDCGNSATAARLLMGAAAGFDLTATFVGDESLRRRPMRRVSEPLTRMGARFEGGERLPLTLHGGRLGGIDHLSAIPSAQVKSAILLAGLKAHGAVRVSEPLPSRDHTEIMLGQFGCAVEVDGAAVVLGRQRHPRGCALAIAGDTSSASFLWLAAAIVPGSEVRTRGILVNPLRTGFAETLEQMGAAVSLSGERVQSGEIVADVKVGHSPLRAAEVGAERIPATIDEIPALAVAAAFADGETVIGGLGELRHKESDRLGAIVAGLTACGVAAVAEGDTLRIFGRGEARGGAEVHSFGDHRIAMAFAVLGLAAMEPVTVDGAEMIATSFPSFLATLRAAGADIDELE